MLCELSLGIVFSEPLSKERARVSFQFVVLDNR